jgi:hypothetical protein
MGLHGFTTDHAAAAETHQETVFSDCEVDDGAFGLPKFRAGSNFETSLAIMQGSRPRGIPVDKHNY